MEELRKLDRRDFLRVSAVAAGGTMLIACGGGEDAATQPPAGATTGPAAGEPTEAAGPQNTPASEIGQDQATSVAAPTEFKQAPALEGMAGLPPVTERLPKKPYVVPHKWVKPGKYGGHLQMACQSADGWGVGHFIQESMYGHAILRWLRDGLAIGPGLAESYKSNADATEWTFNFREGLKWSDGKPWTTADILYWWEDMVLDEDHPANPPDDYRSSKGTLAKVRAVDEYTLQLTFDAPAVLVPNRFAMWVRRGIGDDFMQPRHYMEQFHPKYNKKIKKGGDWATLHDQKKDFAVNKDSPTMTGWKLKSYKEGTNSVWERNPYYYCVSPQGEQLPYIDGITMTNTQNAEVFKLRLQSGQVDYVHGGHTPLTLGDVAGLRQAEAKSKLELRFWDSGSGTGSMFFLSYDYRDKKYRDLFRKKEFRQGLSHAWNRAEVNKQLYFNQAPELSTGTISKKAIEYNFNDEAKKRYAEWRDAYVKYDPEKAKQLITQAGLKMGPGNKFTFADGSKFELLLQYGAPGDPEHVSKNNLLARDLNAIGLPTRLAPVPAESKSDQWGQGKLMTTTDWEVGDGPDHLSYPQWTTPIQRDHWAPLHGVQYSLKGTKQEKQELDKDPWKRQPPRTQPEKGGPIEKIYGHYEKAKSEVDAFKRHQNVWDVIKVHVEEGPFFMGAVSNPPRIVLVGQGLKNVPTQAELKQYAQGGFVNPWIIPSPAVYDPEIYFWENPEEHTS